MTTPITGVNDGNQVTVDFLIRNPLFLPARILQMLDNAFLTSVIFRNGGPNANGIVGFEESTPLFLGADVEDVAEFAEIPVGAGQRGLPRIAVGTKKGLGVRMSREQREEGKLDDVQRQAKQLANTMVRADERALRAALSHPSIPTIAATEEWGVTGSKIRRDIGNATEVVTSAKPDGSSAEDLLGFVPNVVIMPAAMEPVVLDDDEFLKVYNGNIANENPAYLGAMPGRVGRLSPLLPRFWPSDRALVLEAGTLGFYSDTRPLDVTPVYPEGGGPNGGPTESWRSDATRKRVIGVDQPLAACWITGISAP